MSEADEGPSWLALLRSKHDVCDVIRECGKPMQDVAAKYGFGVYVVRNAIPAQELGQLEQAVACTCGDIEAEYGATKTRVGSKVVSYYKSWQATARLCSCQV